MPERLLQVPTTQSLIGITATQPYLVQLHISSTLSPSLPSYRMGQIMAVAPTRSGRDIVILLYYSHADERKNKSYAALIVINAEKKKLMVRSKEC
jgi:hypothetical protein